MVEPPRVEPPRYVLVTMRLADMKVVHPHQDNSRRCSRCNEIVGVYPASLRELRRHPDMVIECTHCVDQADMVAMEPSARTREEFAAEHRDSVPVSKA